MIHTTTDFVPGKEVVEILGIVRGSTVRARNIGRDIFAGLKNIEAFIIGRKRDDNNIPIDGSHRAQKIKIIEFNLTHMFKMCSVRCLIDTGEEVDFIVSRLFYYP